MNKLNNLFFSFFLSFALLTGSVSAFALSQKGKDKKQNVSFVDRLYKSSGRMVSNVGLGLLASASLFAAHDTLNGGSFSTGGFWGPDGKEELYAEFLTDNSEGDDLCLGKYEYKEGGYTSGDGYHYEMFYLDKLKYRLVYSCFPIAVLGGRLLFYWNILKSAWNDEDRAGVPEAITSVCAIPIFCAALIGLRSTNITKVGSTDFMEWRPFCGGLRRLEPTEAFFRMKKSKDMAFLTASAVGVAMIALPAAIVSFHALKNMTADWRKKNIYWQGGVSVIDTAATSAKKTVNGAIQLVRSMNPF